MDIMQEIVRGDGRCRVIFRALCTRDGIGGILVGGDRWHVGGNVLAVPRKSLTGDGQSCDLYIVPVPGHKDTDAAALVAKYLCGRFAVPVSVTAGIHSDGLNAGEIAEILKNCNDAARGYAETLQV